MVDAILIIVYLMLAATAGTLVYSIMHSVRMSGRTFMRVNGIPVGKISFALFAALAVVLASTFILGSDGTLTINGKPYSDHIWLKAADMFIITASVLLVTASALVAYGIFRRRR